MSERQQGLSIRTRLALSYAGFVVAAGLVMFVAGLLLLRFVPEGYIYDLNGDFVPDRSDLLEVYLRYAAWGLVGLAVVGLVGGWVLAGQVLTPLTRITDAARHVSDGDLSHRIRMPGASNELTDLADTFDGMLDRVQASVDEYRRFAANASHELRTPLAVTRTMIEVAQADENRDVDTLLARIAAMNERSIALTEALLDLASADNGTRETKDVDLAALTEVAVDEMREDAELRELDVTVRCDPARVRGDAALLSQLVSNLVRNALVHNVEGGEVRVSTSTGAGLAYLRVENSGVVIDPSAVAVLTEPFVRGAGRVRAAGERATGAGLGLAIAASIVRAHRGTIDLTPRAGGGLVVVVGLPIT
ncbi:two-component system sensor histidine kinase VanS [Leifsonia sp. AK011]|uniref:sensor histidine kinase n=1 Tax=Leifsonia sp. AK011 TaxID=2723075 RepID=UPI0015C8926C|nr:HAMP domain-containing sensor histidine kinase [Leifsonia sp. AK011]NYF09480.1 two-component system sensor histidine kinase VanS [Leifsonia sp. AK011]